MCIDFFYFPAFRSPSSTPRTGTTTTGMIKNTTKKQKKNIKFWCFFVQSQWHRGLRGVRLERRDRRRGLLDPRGQRHPPGHPGDVLWRAAGAARHQVWHGEGGNKKWWLKFNRFVSNLRGANITSVELESVFDLFLGKFDARQSF